jgi:hypothetical protein
MPPQLRRYAGKLPINQRKVHPQQSALDTQDMPDMARLLDKPEWAAVVELPLLGLERAGMPPEPRHRQHNNPITRYRISYILRCNEIHKA